MAVAGSEPAGGASVPAMGPAVPDEGAGDAAGEEGAAGAEDEAAAARAGRARTGSTASFMVADYDEQVRTDDEHGGGSGEQEHAGGREKGRAPSGGVDRGLAAL